MCVCNNYVKKCYVKLCYYLLLLLLVVSSITIIHLSYTKVSEDRVVVKVYCRYYVISLEIRNKQKGNKSNTFSVKKKFCIRTEFDTTDDKNLS